MEPVKHGFAPLKAASHPTLQSRRILSLAHKSPQRGRLPRTSHLIAVMHKTLLVLATLLTAGALNQPADAQTRRRAISDVHWADAHIVTAAAGSGLFQVEVTASQDLDYVPPSLTPREACQSADKADVLMKAAMRA